MAPKDKKPPQSPWQQGTDVLGIAAPGRRLSPKEQKRRTRWSASGVEGVVPPGKLKPGEGPASEVAVKIEAKKIRRAKQAEQILRKVQQNPEGDFDALVPLAGFVPDLFFDVNDPDNLRSFLQTLADYFKTFPITERTKVDLASVITQSHAPFEIAVAFTILSVIAAQDGRLRQRNKHVLERGSKVFFALAQKVNREAKPPRGLNIRSVSALLTNLPPLALEIPYAYATAAFMHLIELLLPEAPNAQQDLRNFAEQLWARYIGLRSFGNQPLAAMFPREV